MPILGVYTQLISWWPTADTGNFDIPNYPGQTVITDSGNPQLPNITLKFSKPIDPTSYASPASWAQYFVLTSLTHPGASNITSFTNLVWNKDNVSLSFQPSVSLNPGDSYLANLSDSLRDSSGRGIERNYSWTFNVSSVVGVTLPSPVLLSPADETTMLSIPTLMWGIDPAYVVPSGSTLFFDVGVYTDPNLNTLLYHTLQPAVSGSVSSIPGVAYKLFQTTPTLPANSVNNGALLYWNVLSVLENASGGVTSQTAPSEPFQFYLDAPPLNSQGVASTVGEATFSALRQTLDPLSALSFTATGVYPALGSAFQDLSSRVNGSFPPIQVAFNLALAPNQGSLFNVFRSNIVGFSGRQLVPGTWSPGSGSMLSPNEQIAASGATMLFTSAEPFIRNCRYVIEVDQRLQSIDGQTLPEPLRWNWFSWYAPFLVDPYTVRQRLGEYSAHISDEDLYYAIWRASIRTNREVMWYLPLAAYRGGPTTEEIINFTTHNSFAMCAFCELEATMRLLEKLVGRAAEDGDTSESFKESEYKVGADRMKSIEAAIKAFRPEWETYRAEISFKKARPRTTVKSAAWRGNWDFSYRGRKGF